MNYFGHAVVASWRVPPAPGVTLGAMLPDFQTMSGARVASCTDAAITAGIELHHRTDAAFHRLPAFVGLTRELEERLARAGVARGPMRAVGHVGVELLLDGVLVADAAARAAYLAALEHPIDTLSWRDAGDDERFAFVHGKLREHGVPDDLVRPEAAAARVLRMIAHRPLLRASADEAAVIRRELAAVAPRVRVAAATILSSLRAALEEA